MFAVVAVGVDEISTETATAKMIRREAFVEFEGIVVRLDDAWQRQTEQKGKISFGSHVFALQHSWWTQDEERRKKKEVR